MKIVQNFDISEFSFFNKNQTLQVSQVKISVYFLYRCLNIMSKFHLDRIIIFSFIRKTMKYYSNYRARRKYIYFFLKAGHIILIIYGIICIYKYYLVSI